MSYFNPFPKVFYEFPDSVIRNYTDISIRPAVVDEMLKLPGALEQYQVSDGETPETIAFDLYGDASMHWVIMIANNIMNVYTDWPKTEKVLRNVVYDKYREQEDSEGVVRTLTDTQVAEWAEFTGTTAEQFTSQIDIHDSDNSPKVTMHPHHFIDSSGHVYSWGTHTYDLDWLGRPMANIEGYDAELIPISHWQYELEENEKNRYIYVPTLENANKMIRELRPLVNG